MPAAGTKQLQIPEPATLASPSSASTITPGAVLSDFEQICVALPVSGALIAVRELAGLRCTISFGKAPRVGSRFAPASLALESLETGEVALSEDALFDPRIDSAAAVRLGIRSAIAVPIRAQANIVGLIEIFCSEPSAFSLETVARLERFAKSFAALMILEAANGGQPIVGGPVDHPIVLQNVSSNQEVEEFREPKAPDIKTVAKIRPESLARATPGIAKTTGTPLVTAPKNAALVECAPATATQPSIAERITELKLKFQKLSAPVATRIAVFLGKVDEWTSPQSPTAGTAQLPSDRPTPARVWLIAGVLLLAISLLFLFLLRGITSSEDPSDDSLNRQIHSTLESFTA